MMDMKFPTSQASAVKLVLTLDISKASAMIFTKVLSMSCVPRVGEGVCIGGRSGAITPRAWDVVHHLAGGSVTVGLRMSRLVTRREVKLVEAAGWERS